MNHLDNFMGIVIVLLPLHKNGSDCRFHRSDAHNIFVASDQQSMKL